MLRHRTVRAAKTRTTALGWAATAGSRPALDRSAVCQFPRPSPSHRYRAADAAIGTKTSIRKTTKSFFNGPCGWISAKDIVRLADCAMAACRTKWMRLTRDMFDLTFLGTSASVPSADRNHPGLLVEAGGHRIMVDCGEGTQRQLLRSGAGFRRLDRLLLTHGHFDHVLGIPGLFSTLRLRQSADVMTVHGSPGTLDVVVRMLAGLWGEGRAPIPLQLVPLAEGRILDAGAFTVDCFRVRHRDTDSFAFSFESQHRRHLLPDRLSILGVPDGPVRKDLADGKPITLAGGQTIDPEDVLGPAVRRKKIAIVGDTETTDGLAEHVRDADLLVIEATFVERDAAMALDYGHLTAAKAAELATAANVKQLILTHISGRYPDEEILAEALKIFPNTQVATDLDRLAI
jgi:ribonuclease Z